jgi:hypothetical protein
MDGTEETETEEGGDGGDGGHGPSFKHGVAETRSHAENCLG